MAKKPDMKSKTSKNKPKTGKTVSKKDVKQIVKDEIYRLSETKSLENEIAEEVITSNRDVDPKVVDLTAISRGSQHFNRQGNEILLTGIKNRMLLHARPNPNEGGTNSAVIVREALIRTPFDKAGTLNLLFIRNGNAKAWSDTDQGEKYLLPFNHNEFDILYQKTHKLGMFNDTYTNQFPSNKIVKWYRQQEQKIVWADADAASTPNHLYLYVIFCINANMDYGGSGETGAAAFECTSLLTTYFKDF